ncbi:secreted antigen 1 [Babesia divergens]|uniref:Secreted antigen 1 n=1 Tax=Babesia divergens TaxID=32595 RepID=A0AAD9LHP7_BABDI|nr:secreted antigen 1 [Babesia divergens]
MTKQEVTCDFKDPKNLKDILDLLVKLGESVQAKKNVGQKLLQDVRKYCKDAEKFYQSGSGSEVLSTVFSNAYGIRSTILENSESSGTYNNFDRDHNAQDCALNVAEALKKCLPKAYAALYFLLFMGSKTDFSTLQGGHWSNNNVNGSGGSGKDLFNWLTKEKNLSRTLTPGLIKRGFDQGKLHNSNDGSTVAPVIKQIIKHNTPGPLQNALSYLLFSCPWDDALLGHAICFLYEFCSRVSQGSERFLQDPYKEHSEAFKDVCSALKSDLQPFIDGSSGLSAVSQGNQNLFKDLWDDGKFDKYCEWLKRNIYRIIGSLASMSGESSAWDLSALQSASSAGPFKYGFVFKASWQDGKINSKLSPFISKLIDSDSGSLQNFKKFLENPSTPSSAGATAAGAAGGIFGLGGAGAGAAYGLNLFGFKNLVTGFLK